MNVIYTGNYSINWDYFKGIQDWQIYNFYHLQKYCERHNIALRIIDNSHVGMNSAFRYARSISNDRADGWSIATWCSVAAVTEFADSNEFDNFAWVDLDLCIIKPGINIFDQLKGDVLLDIDDVLSPRGNIKERFVEGMAGFPYKQYCNTSIIVTNKQGAMDIKNRLLNLNLHPYQTGFLDRLVEFYKNDKEFLCDEGFIEAVLNSETYIKFQRWPEILKSEVITPVSPHRDYWLDRFSYHFASHTKDLITGFWKEREVYR